MGFIDLTGQRFGYLVVVSRHYPYIKSEGTKWLCKCDCGREKVINGTSLKRGATKSCGCYARKITSQLTTTHGLSKTRLYNCWRGMFSRKKYNPKYRDREICDEWRKFEAFADWAYKNGYYDGLSLDRVDNSKGYSPNNCRWATRTVQNRNKSNNVILEYNGESKCISEWCETLGIEKGTVWSRYKKGYSVEDILSPLNHKTKRHIMRRNNT